MIYQFRFFPEEQPAGDHASSRSGIAESDADLNTLAKAALAKWQTTPGFTLLWKTSEQFATDVTNFERAFLARQAAGGHQSADSNLLKELDKQADHALSYVKAYIKEVWEDAAVAQYPRYGIIKDGQNWILPRDRDERLAAYDLMEEALQADRLTDRRYGLQFWNDLEEQYAAALDAAVEHKQNVSGNVARKNTARKEIRRVLRALLYLIKANYPDTWKQEMRLWGFMKENY